MPSLLQPRAASATANADAACPDANTPVDRLTQDAAEAAVVCLVNKQRSAANVPPLGTAPKPVVAVQKVKGAAPVAGSGGRIEIEPVEGDFGKILK